MKTKVLKIDHEYPDIEKIGECVKVIREGGLVVFPTETVYGVGADFDNPGAMKRLREVKKREKGKPFSVLISQVGLISNYTSSTNPQIYKLISEYWPGPLTVVVPAKEGNGTIGVRMPDNTIALKLVEESHSRFAAPSANFEGNDPPSTCDEALRDLDGLVDIAIDGGKSNIGRGSTVVDFTGENPTILRDGSLSQRNIDQATNRKTILFVCTGNSCRSVMAEYLLKERVKGRDDIEVLSAGTGVFIQSTASRETISVLQEEGIDATKHYSQSVGTILLKKSDLILVMTRAHRQLVLERVPSVEKRVYLLQEFASKPPNIQAQMDIPDPIGSSKEAYKECLSVIKESIDKLVELF